MRGHLRGAFSHIIRPPCSKDVEPIPASIATELDEIFREFYGSPKTRLLFGHRYDDALETQDGYGLKVAIRLQPVSTTLSGPSTPFSFERYRWGYTTPVV